MTALAWAGSSIILKHISGRIDTLATNMLRLWTGSVVLVVFVVLSGRSGSYVDMAVEPILLVVASGLVALAIGDTVYIKSLTFIDVSRAFPIGQCTFPVLTMCVAILLLAEPFAWFNVVGALLVVVGLYLVAVLGRAGTASGVGEGNDGKGIALAFLAAVTWVVGATTLKLGVADMDAFVAAAVRIPVGAIALTGFVVGRRGKQALRFKKYGVRNLGMTVGAGVLTYGVAAVSYVTAMQLLGAGRAVLITAVAPIFVLPLSVLVLKERPTMYGIGGVVVCVSGVILVSLD